MHSMPSISSPQGSLQNYRSAAKDHIFAAPLICVGDVQHSDKPPEEFNCSRDLHCKGQQLLRAPCKCSCREDSVAPHICVTAAQHFVKLPGNPECSRDLHRQRQQLLRAPTASLQWQHQPSRPFKQLPVWKVKYPALLCHLMHALLRPAFVKMRTPSLGYHLHAGLR